MIMLWFTHCAAGERQPGCWSYGIDPRALEHQKRFKGKTWTLWVNGITRGAQGHVNVKASKSTSIKLCKLIKCSTDTGLVRW